MNIKKSKNQDIIEINYYTNNWGNLIDAIINLSPMLIPILMLVYSSNLQLEYLFIISFIILIATLIINVFTRVYHNAFLIIENDKLLVKLRTKTFEFNIDRITSISFDSNYQKYFATSIVEIAIQLEDGKIERLIINRYKGRNPINAYKKLIKVLSKNSELMKKVQPLSSVSL